MKAYIDGQLREQRRSSSRGDADAMSDRERGTATRRRHQAGSGRAPQTQARDVGRVQGEPHRSLRRGRLLERRTQGRQVGHAEQRRAPPENELPAIDKPEQLAELLGVTIPQLKGMAYHRDAATSLHYVRLTIPKRATAPSADLGTEEATQGSTALDSPQHRRAVAGSRFGARVPRRTVDPLERQEFTRTRKSC